MRVLRAFTLASVLVCAACLVPGHAVAYPNAFATYPEGVSRTECVDCHAAVEPDILTPGEDPLLLAAVRKGPHGSYSSLTDKCQTCHALHAAPAEGTKLLVAGTLEDICVSCHDGTGGSGVYGVIRARTGTDPAAIHRIGEATVVPGGDPSGGSATVDFSGPGDTLTCSDCHSAHDSATVAPFTGDRLRASVASDTAIDAKTSRLLKKRPTGADSAVDEYGAGWCAACHKGRLVQHSEDSGAMRDHPVMGDDSYTYDRVPVVTSVASTETTLGTLGQSNRGYVMPGPLLSEPTQKTALQEGAAPLCQQCHEDARDVGPSVRKTNPTLTSADQEFSVTTYGGTEPGDNPRFQAFPHESENANFLVRAPQPAEPYMLCLDCHSLVHDASPPDDYVEIFAEGDHDDAQPAGDPYDVLVDCDLCHAADLNAVHADQCTTCHSSPYDTLGSWDAGCQQGGCHTTLHADSTIAHLPWSDSYGGGNCGLCHTAGVGPPNQSKCVNCHTLYSPSDAVPPVTSCNAVASYVGAALIKFSITDSGKVGVGTTFYQLDGGPTLVGGSVLVDTAGAHTLEFWSVDQAGNVETPAKSASFTITEDTTPPVTTANAQSTYYYYPAQITLTATDASFLGVKTTYYSLDGGPTQTGTLVTVPAPTGVYAHTLQFWSEDWSGNVESTKTANFTVVGGTVTLRLLWGATPGPGDWADWEVRRGSSTGALVASGSAEYPWDGIDEVAVPVWGTTYYVKIAWGTSTEPYDETTFPSVVATTPGSVIDLYY